MKNFSLHLLAASQRERISGVTSFIGEDASGSFGLLAGHERFLTSLVFGLARFRCGNEAWLFVALPRALAYFSGQDLYLCTRRYLIDGDYNRISAALTGELLDEEENLREMREQMYRVEEELLRRLWRRGREA